MGPTPAASPSHTSKEEEEEEGGKTASATNAPLSSRHMTFTQLSELSKQVFPALCEAQQVMAREPKKGACLRGEKGDKLSIKGLDPKRQIRQY